MTLPQSLLGMQAYGRLSSAVSKSARSAVASSMIADGQSVAQIDAPG